MAALNVPISGATIQSKELAYHDLLKEIPLTAMDPRTIVRTPSKTIISKPGCNKTFKDHAWKIPTEGISNVISYKYLDPLNRLCYTNVECVAIYAQDRATNAIVRYEYPIIVKDKFRFITVLYKLTTDNNLVKFTQVEAKSMSKIAEMTYDMFKQLDITTDVAERCKLILKTANSMGKLCDNLEMEEPFPASGLPSELKASLAARPDLMAVIAVEDDDFKLPQTFDTGFAELFNVIPEIDDKLNNAFLESGWLQLESGTSTNPQQIESVPLYVGDPENSVTYRALNMLITYTPATKVPSTLFNVFDPLTEEQYYQKFGKSVNRIDPILGLLDIQKVTPRRIPASKANAVPVADKASVDTFFTNIAGLKGEQLLKQILSMLSIPITADGNISRYNFEIVSRFLISIYRYLMLEEVPTALARTKISTVCSIYGAFNAMEDILHSIGIFENASIHEMMGILPRLTPILFCVTKQEKNKNMTAVFKSKIPPDNADLAKRLTDEVTFKQTVTVIPPAPTIPPLSSVPAASTKLSNTTRSTGESGYKSVSSGSRFSKSSSYGTNCINGTHSVTYSPLIPSRTIIQNIIQKGVAMTTTNYEHIYYEEGKMKMSTWVSNPQTIRDQAINVNREDYFDRFYPRPNAVVNTNAILTNPNCEDTMDLACLDSILSTTHIDTRKFSTILMSKIRATRRYGEKISPLMIKYRERYNNSTLYTVGYIIQNMLQDFENEGFQPRFGATPANAISTFNMNTDGNAVDAEVDRLEDAMSDGCIFLNAKDFSQRDFQIMKIISAGPSCIQTSLDNETRHIGSSIKIEGSVRWALYNDENINVDNNYGLITSAHVSAFLAKLNNVYKDKDAMVSGYMQAATILNGKIKEVSYRKTPCNRFIMSTLEIGQINLPRVVGHNFLWTLLDLEPARESATYFVKEHEALLGASNVVLNLVSVFVAAHITIGVSAFLDNWNITGADINASVLPAENANNLATFIQQLVTAKAGVAAPILAISTGLASQISDVTISPLIFNGRCWCNQLNGVSCMMYDEEDLWHGVWGEYIPYLLDPIATSFQYQAWLSIWGILAPDVTFELTTEINMLGPQQLRMWNAYNGDTQYEAIGASKTPYRKAPYGLLVINAVRQQYGVHQPWNLTQQIYVQVGNKIEKLGNSELFQPEYDEELGIIKIGTLITYRWSVCRSIIVALTPATIGDAMFHNLATCKFTALNSAGLYLHDTQVGVPMSAGLFCESGVVGLEIYNVGGSASGSAVASEN